MLHVMGGKQGDPTDPLSDFREFCLIEGQHLPSFHSLGLGFEVYFASPGPLCVVRAGMGILFHGVVLLHPRTSQGEGI